MVLIQGSEISWSLVETFYDEVDCYVCKNVGNSHMFAKDFVQHI